MNVNIVTHVGKVLPINPFPRKLLLKLQEVYKIYPDSCSAVKPNEMRNKSSKCHPSGCEAEYLRASLLFRDKADKTWFVLVGLHQECSSSRKLLLLYQLILFGSLGHCFLLFVLLFP